MSALPKPITVQPLPKQAPKLTIFRPRGRYNVGHYKPSPYSQAWEDHKRQNPKLAKFLGLDKPDAEPPRHKTHITPMEE